MFVGLGCLKLLIRFKLAMTFNREKECKQNMYVMKAKLSPTSFKEVERLYIEKYGYVKPRFNMMDEYHGRLKGADVIYDYDEAMKLRAEYEELIRTSKFRCETVKGKKL